MGQSLESLERRAGPSAIADKTILLTPDRLKDLVSYQGRIPRFLPTPVIAGIVQYELAIIPPPGTQPDDICEHIPGVGGVYGFRDPKGEPRGTGQVVILTSPEAYTVKSSISEYLTAPKV